MPDSYHRTWKLQMDPLCILSKTLSYLWFSNKLLPQISISSLSIWTEGNFLDVEDYRHGNYIMFLLFVLPIFFCLSSFQKKKYVRFFFWRKRLSLGHASFMAIWICNLVSFSQLFFSLICYLDREIPIRFSLLNSWILIDIGKEDMQDQNIMVIAL